MEKKTKAASKNIEGKDITAPKVSSTAGKAVKKKNSSESKIYGKSGGKGG